MWFMWSLVQYGVLIYGIAALEGLQIQTWRAFAAAMSVWVFELETEKDVILWLVLCDFAG